MKGCRPCPAESAGAWQFPGVGWVCPTVVSDDLHIQYPETMPRSEVVKIAKEAIQAWGPKGKKSAIRKHK